MKGSFGMAETISLAAKSEALEENRVAASTLTDRYQTTVPEPVRKALGLSRRDRIVYSIDSDGRVYLSRAEDEDNDPVVEKFLDFLAKDIEQNPHRVKPITVEWANRVRALVKDVDIGDLNEPLSGDDD